ncbi:MAG: SDR family oxidoreductase [Pseudomonadota bacterium]
MKQRVLITGGLGYVGGRIAQALLTAGHSVRCGTRRANLSAPAWLPEMALVRLDWASPDSLAEACRGIECVIHLAAMNEIESAQDPLGALQMNGLASLRLLEAAKHAAVRRFIYFSTAHVYGAPLQGEISETSLPRPIHPYAITHKVAEDFVSAAHDQKQIEGLVIRLSNGFGAPLTAQIDRWTLLVNDLCRQAVTRGELSLNSAGTQLRDFITLADVARAVNHLLQLDVTQLGDGLFNLGSGESVSIFAMAQRIAGRWHALSGQTAPIIRPEPKPAANSNSNSLTVAALNYRCAKLAATGFALTSQVDREIDDTLRLCTQAFGQQRKI